MGPEAAILVWLAFSFQKLATQHVFLSPGEVNTVYVFLHGCFATVSAEQVLSVCGAKQNQKSLLRPHGYRLCLALELEAPAPVPGPLG